ncbi:MAG: hypothetical protein ACI8Z1_001028 [Candidatus Azotimanducaceae bacterium]|jgi:hypothetical protein
MPYPEDLRYIAVTTDLPCLLVEAAELQGSDVADKAFRRFRESVFFYGTPFDSVSRASAALELSAGLVIDRLLNDAGSKDVAACLADWEETREPNDYLRGLAETETDHLSGA